VRLVVEVDGPYHEERARHDAARDRALRAMGWQVVRAREEHVFADLDAAVTAIAATARRLAAPGR
jgi:very-short-patch-repair endonuclease